jgi:hypothetical protein
MAIEVGTAGSRASAITPGTIHASMTVIMFKDPRGERRIRRVLGVGTFSGEGRGGDYLSRVRGRELRDGSDRGRRWQRHGRSG